MAKQQHNECYDFIESILENSEEILFENFTNLNINHTMKNPLVIGSDKIESYTELAFDFENDKLFISLEIPFNPANLAKTIHVSNAVLAVPMDQVKEAFGRAFENRKKSKTSSKRKR